MCGSFLKKTNVSVKLILFVDYFNNSLRVTSPA
jgi:hypothetical protein